MRDYSAKILLFGEYSILLGSNALVIPFQRFKGHFVFNSNNNQQKYDDYKEIIKLFINHLEKVTEKMTCPIETKLLETDMTNGLQFSSYIPVSYGLGSSGAFCAAVYSEYNLNKIEPAKKENYLIYKNDLALMESFFHGKSSGTDPLCILVNKPLLVSEDKIFKVRFEKDKTKPEIFIIDTLKQGETGKLVEHFKQSWENQEYLFYMMNHYIPLNNKCIASLLNNGPDFMKEIQLLSEYQLHLFKEMIPANELTHWHNGHESNLFSLKLCGSGGGGFLLGFTEDFDSTVEYFNTHKIPLLKVEI